jgi:hypothetical protein
MVMARVRVKLIAAALAWMVTAQVLAACVDVDINARLPLSLGTLTTLPGDSGFLELHPDHGLSVSTSGAVHSGQFGLGEFEITGPVRAELTLMVEVVETTDTPKPHLALAEVLTESLGGVVRLGLHGGRVVVKLPEHGNDVGRSRLRLPIGAVMRFTNSPEREQAEYRVVAECVSMALP